MRADRLEAPSSSSCPARSVNARPPPRPEWKLSRPFVGTPEPARAASAHRGPAASAPAFAIRTAEREAVRTWYRRLLRRSLPGRKRSHRANATAAN